jgi:ferredoxin--NADP+ reductase
MDAVITRRPPPARMPRADLTEPNATITEREDVSPSVARFRIRPDDGVPAFEPGQYLALGLEAQGRPLQRPYSTASARGETDALEFLVRLVPDGALTPRLWPLRAGDRVRLGRPKGLFTADAADPRRPVYVATGTGIAPLLSMLETRLRETDDGPAARRPLVIHGVARSPDLAWRTRFEALAARGRIAYVPAVTRPADPANAGWTGVTGRVDALLPSILAETGSDPGATVAFICGNPGMTDAAAAALRAFGMPDEAVRSEAYWVAAGPA